MSAETTSKKIELVHMEVIEETGLFAVRRAIPLPAGSVRAEQSVVTWHYASEKSMKDGYPSMMSRCGKADLNDAPLPLRLGPVRVVCDDCHITQAQIDSANKIIQNR